MSTPKIVDLNALIPDEVTIHFGDQDIKIQPPKTADILRLGFIGQKLSEGASMGEAELDAAVEANSALIIKLIPELAGQTLNTPQLLMLNKIIGNMAVPPENEELERRGIQVDSPKKTA